MQGLHSRLSSIYILGITLAVVAMPFIFSVTIDNESGAARSFRFSLTEMLLFPVGVLGLIMFFWQIRRFRAIMLPSLASLIFAASAFIHFGEEGISEVIQFFGGFLLPFFGFAFCLGHRNSLKMVVRAAALACIVSAFLALVQAFSGTPFFFVRGGFPNNHTYSLFLLVCFPFLYIELVRISGYRNLGLFLAVLAGILVSITIKDTGQLLSFSIVFALLQFYVLRQGRLCRWVMICAALLAMLSLHSSIHHQEVQRFISPYEVSDVAAVFERNQQYIAAEAPKALAAKMRGVNLSLGIWALPLPAMHDIEIKSHTNKEILKQRYAEWIAALRMISANPLLGVGPGAYQKNIGNYYFPLEKLNTAAPDTQNGWLIAASSVGLPFLGIILLALLPALGISPLIRNHTNSGNAEDQDFSLNRLAVSGSVLGLLLGGFWTPVLQVGTLVPLAFLLALVTKISNAEAAAVFVTTRKLLLRKPVIAGSVCFSVAALAVALSMAGKSKNAEPAFIWKNAEDALRVTHPMEMVSYPHPEKEKFLKIPQGAGHGWLGKGGGSAAFAVELPKKGTYSLWTRALWSDGCGNSLYLRINQGRRFSVGNDAVFGDWHWIKAGQFSLPQGISELEFSNREEGTAIAQILLTNSSNFIPEGSAHLAYSRNLSDYPLIGWKAPNSPHWKQVADGMEVPCGSDGLSPALIDYDVDWDFRIDCHLRRSNPKGDLNIVFLYSDPQNYYSVEFLPSSIRLVRTHQGQKELLQSHDFKTNSLAKSKYENLSIAFRNGIIQVYHNAALIMETVDRRSGRGYCGFGSHQGGVVVRSFDLRPLDGIYFLADRKKLDQMDLGKDRILKIGDPGWRNYAISVTGTKEKMPSFRFNLSDTRKDFLSVSPTSSSIVIEAIGNNKVLQKELFKIPKIGTSENLSFMARYVDGEIYLAMNSSEIGRAFFGYGPRKGSVEIPTGGVSHIEVKEARRFFDGFGGCDGNNIASWQRISGTWQIVKGSTEGLQDCLGQFAGGVAAAFTGKEAWQNYDFRCMVRQGATNGMGFYTYYTDTDNNDLVRFCSEDSSLPYAGKIQFVRRDEGKERILAVSNWRVPADQWVELRQVGSSGREVVYIDGQKLLTVPSRSSTHGKVGLFSEENIGSYFDNICVDFR